MPQCWHWGRENPSGVCTGEAGRPATTCTKKLHFPCWQSVQHSPFLLCPCLSRFHRPISKATVTPPRKHACTCYFSSPLSCLLYVLFSIVTAKCRFCRLVLKSAPGVLYVQYIAVCCKPKASSQTQGWDTMNIKAVLLCKKQCFCNTLSFAFCLPVAWHIIILCIVPSLSPPLQIMQFFRRFWLHDCKLQSLQDIVR